VQRGIQNDGSFLLPRSSGKYQQTVALKASTNGVSHSFLLTRKDQEFVRMHASRTIRVLVSLGAELGLNSDGTYICRLTIQHSVMFTRKERGLFLENQNGSVYY